VTHTEVFNSLTRTEVLRQSVAGRGRGYSEQLTADREDNRRREQNGYS
jgi:hypothetical protein